MNQIIVTDLTRFKDPAHVCVAGLTLDGQECIRPMKAKVPGQSHPYLTYDECKLGQILPGVIIEADFRSNGHIDAPHIEDQYYRNLRVVRQSTSAEFYDVLNASATTSLAAGFGVPVQTKYIPVNGPAPLRSIITLKIDPAQLTISNSFDKLRASFVDGVGVRLDGLSVTDLCFVDYFKNGKASLREVTNFCHNENEIFVRVGLTRPFASPDGRDGYWLQVNGIYTFPDVPNNIRKF